MKATKWRIAVLAVAAVLLGAAVGYTAPTVLYSTFAPGDTWGDGATGIGGPIQPDVSHTQAQRFSFSGANPYNLLSVEVVVRSTLGEQPSEVHVMLMTEEGGLPGAILESFSFEGPFSSSGQVLTGVSALRPLLEPGTHYWVAATASEDGRVGWAQAPSESPWIDQWWRVAGWSNVEGEPWTAGGMKPPFVTRVTGIPIPAPSALALGLIGAALVRRLRRRPAE